MNISETLREKSAKSWTILKLTLTRFSEIDGTQRAGAFAYYAFFPLFPLLILVVSFASLFINGSSATRAVIFFIQNYLVISAEVRQLILTTITNVVHAGSQAGIIAFVMLIWVSGNFFTTLVSATNRAWGSTGYKWWQMPFRSLQLLGVTISAVLLGIVVPILARMAKDWFSELFSRQIVYRLAVYVLSSLIFYICLLLFYKLAPLRRTRFSEVWFPALVVTILLKCGEGLFLIYLREFSTINAVYGTAGGFITMLLWIYISGCIFIYGACLCAVLSDSNKPVTIPEN